jgi:hypothetical protein
MELSLSCRLVRVHLNHPQRFLFPLLALGFPISCCCSDQGCGMKKAFRGSRDLAIVLLVSFCVVLLKNIHHGFSPRPLPWVVS